MLTTMLTDSERMATVTAKPRGSLFAPETAQQITARVRSGQTYQQVADDYGVTREAIRQVVAKTDRGASKAGRKARKTAREQAQRQAAEQRIAERARHGLLLAGSAQCRVCLGPIPPERLGMFTDRAVKTCSKAHHDLWVLTRLHLDPAAYTRHRRSQAQGYLDHPERYPASMLAWARRVLDDPKVAAPRWASSPRVQAGLDEVERLREQTRRSQRREMPPDSRLGIVRHEDAGLPAPR